MVADPIFRAARPQDAPALVDLVRNGFSPALLDVFIYGCAGIERYIRMLVEDAARAADTRYFVAESAGAVVGGIEMRCLPDTLFLNYVAVRSDHRAAGVASQLLAHAISMLADASHRRLALDVLEDNHPALRWYDKLGLARTGSTAWYTARLPDLAGAPCARISGLPQAGACYDAFGFSQVNVQTASARYDVGLLGQRWFRVTSAPAFVDSALHAALRALDPSRALLGLLPGSEPAPAEASRLTTTIRMTGDLQLTARKLAALAAR